MVKRTDITHISGTVDELARLKLRRTDTREGKWRRPKELEEQSELRTRTAKRQGRNAEIKSNGRDQVGAEFRSKLQTLSEIIRKEMKKTRKTGF